MSENSEILSLLNELHGGSEFPSPIVVVLLGGPSGYFDFPTGWYSAAMQYLCKTVSDLGGSMVLVASEETPGWAFDSLPPDPVHPPQLQVRWDPLKPESYKAKYMAALAGADGIVVTPDNMEMANDACDSGKPVFLTGGDLAKGRLFSFYRRLKQEGRLQALDRLNELA